MVFCQILTSCKSARSRKSEKDFARKHDFKNIKFSLKIRDIHKIEKNNSIVISVFGYENKENYLYIKKIL